MIYLDNSATTRQDPQVTELMIRYMEHDFGNPSSLHNMGIIAEKAMKQARRQVLTAMNKNQGQLYFTSGGTEANNMAIFGAVDAQKRYGNKIITSAIEHPSVMEACKKLERMGFELVYIGVDEQCHFDLETFKSAVDENTILITVMQVNNETGAIMPIDEIGQSKRKALLHTDCVQAFTKTDLKAAADIITLSGHKIHGPKGVGAIYLNEGVRIPALLVGGGQESNMRSGTENVPAIAGLGKSAQLAEQVSDKMKKYLLKGIKETIKDIRINSPEDSISSILNISFLGTRGEVLLHILEQEGIYVSTGSACSSNHQGQSHVLKAMGRQEKEIEGALRFSFSHHNTLQEMDIVLDKLKQAVDKFRRLGSFR